MSNTDLPSDIWKPIVRPLYQEIASLIRARENCRHMATENNWYSRHGETLEKIAKDFLPSGGGIDRGTEIDLGSSKPEKLVLSFSYHHMDDNGYYDSWTDHTVIIKPSLQFGFDMRITGHDHRGVKDYLYETYDYALRQLIWQTDDCEWHSERYEEVPS